MTHQSALSSLAIAGTLGIMIAAASAQEQGKYPNWSGQWTWVPDGGQPRYDMNKPLRTRPWTVMKTYRHLPNVVWGENNCIEGQTWVTIGKQVYYLSGDGTIMPIKKNQPPPDLRYFNRVK